MAQKISLTGLFLSIKARRALLKSMMKGSLFIAFLALMPSPAHSFDQLKSDHELLTAVIHGKTKTVVSLLRDGANVDSHDRYGKTALMWAILKGRPALARYLVEQGANVNARDWENTTSLMWAVVTGDSDMVKFLIDNNAHLHVKDMYGDTALGMALKRGRDEIAEILMKAGAFE